MSGGFGLPILNLSGSLAALGEKFDKGYDQAQAPDILAALLRGQGQTQAAPLGAIQARGLGTGDASAPDGLGSLGSAYKSPLPTFARAEGSTPSTNIRGLIADVATRNDIDPNYLGKLVHIESRGDPNAYNKGSGASGLGQFIPSTAKAYGLTDPFDPAKNLQATADLTIDNRGTLRQRLGRDPTPGELYLGHQQGAAGAARLLANPDVPAERLVGRKAVLANGGTPGMTAREFAGKWTSRFDGQGATVASAEPDAANMPAQGSAPAGFVIPGGAGAAGGGVGLPGAAVAARGNLDPALLARALDNSITAPFATALIGAQFKSGDDYSMQAVGDSLYRFNKRTGSVELVPGVTKPQTTTVGQGQTLVDQVSGRPIFSSPAAPTNVAAGGRLVDPVTGKEVYAAPEKPVSLAPGATMYDPTTGRAIVTAPEKAGTPSFVQLNGRLVMADPGTGAARDVTPADLPQGYRAASAEERQAYKVKDDTPLFIGPDGKPQTLAGQTINVNPGERAQESAIGADYGKRFTEMMRSGASAGTQVNTISAMEKAMNSPGFYSGTGGPAHLAFNRALSSLPGGFKDPKKVAPAEMFDALSNKVILDGLGGSLGAGISNGDRDFIQRTAPDLTKTKEGNAQLLSYARALAERQQQVAKFAREYYVRNGNKLDPGFDTALQDWADANPITPGGRRGPTGQPQRQAPAQQNPAAPAVTDLEAEARRRGLIQ